MAYNESKKLNASQLKWIAIWIFIYFPLIINFVQFT